MENVRQNIKLLKELVKKEKQRTFLSRATVFSSSRVVLPDCPSRRTEERDDRAVGGAQLSALLSTVKAQLTENHCAIHKYCLFLHIGLQKE